MRPPSASQAAKEEALAPTTVAPMMTAVAMLPTAQRCARFAKIATCGGPLLGRCHDFHLHGLTVGPSRPIVKRA